MRNVDEHAFDCLTEETAWLTGLLFSDGCLSGSHNGIALSSTDRDLVESARRILKSEHAIWSFTPTHSFGTATQHRLSIRNKALFQAYIGLGIPVTKRDRTAFPVLPASLKRDFIRGVFDGDGGISIKSAPQAYFSGPLEFARVLRQHLIDVVGIDTSKLYEPKQTHGVGAVHIWSKPSMHKLFHYMYDGATVYGNRKRDTWSRYFLLPRGLFEGVSA